MNGTAISTLIAVVSLVLSVSASVFISGARWGQVVATLNDLQRDRVRQSDITGMRDRLSRIEALFRLTLKDGSK